ncbi:hypothetical protein, partial [Gloeocapsa sp. PCC 73106]|uniref:hypothetical protein n=1 Tax=Gloeocapsa sp. PCC 73106 TaxID=102232 RepID=UPI0002ACF625
MTRFIYDQFSKDYLEALLKPYGGVEVAKSVAGEIKEVDLYFIPNTPSLPPELGILARLAATPSLFEPYRNPASVKEIRDCLLKLLEIMAQLQREATRNNRRLSEEELPNLWIITPTASQPILQGFKAEIASDSGIYFLPQLLKTAIVVIHQLSVTPETLWLRLLGRGRVQQQAIDELINLPEDYPNKSITLEILYTLQKNLEINQGNIEPEDRELIMRLAPLYQEDRARAIEEGFQRGKTEGKAEGKAEGK